MDKVRTPPTSKGSRGRFWEIPLTVARANAPHNPDDATVALVLIEAPYANMTMHSFLISLVHLRAIPGREPPVHHRPDASHEIALFPLDPTAPRDPVVQGMAPPKAVKVGRPTYIGQLGGLSDDAARDVVLQVAQDVADAKLNPDKDYLKWWVHRFGAHCMKPGWDRWSDKFVVDGREIIVPLKPLPGES